MKGGWGKWSFCGRKEERGDSVQRRSFLLWVCPDPRVGGVYLSFSS